MYSLWLRRSCSEIKPTSRRAFEPFRTSEKIDLLFSCAAVQSVRQGSFEDSFVQASERREQKATSRNGRDFAVDWMNESAATSGGMKMKFWLYSTVGSAHTRGDAQARLPVNRKKILERSRSQSFHSPLRFPRRARRDSCPPPTETCDKRLLRSAPPASLW